MKKGEIDRLDKIAGEKACEIADGRCEICGGIGDDPHHIVKRRNLQVRWFLENIVWVCRKCHDWAENNPKAFLDWAIANRDMVRIREMANGHKKLFYKDILNYLEGYEQIKD